MKPGLLALTALLAFSSSATAAPKLGAADKAWIDNCTGRLTKSEQKPKGARICCTCMHEQVGNNEEMTQTGLERSWPPVHISCRMKAGWNKERTP